VEISILLTSEALSRSSQNFCLASEEFKKKSCSCLQRIIISFYCEDYWDYSLCDYSERDISSNWTL